MPARVYRFEAIPAGMVVEGPAIVESGFTTLVLPGRVTAHRDALGSIIIDLGTMEDGP
jgi:N-methylhydantoinase A/oxoprolinase/acetone carboxylase beta subunit